MDTMIKDGEQDLNYAYPNSKVTFKDTEKPLKQNTVPYYQECTLV